MNSSERITEYLRAIDTCTEVMRCAVRGMEPNLALAVIKSAVRNVTKEIEGSRS